MFIRFGRPVLAAATLLAATFAHAQVSVQERLAADQPPVVVAHRSAVLGGFPENSLAWIQYAVDLGIDAVHINPQLTRDDQYVLMHDSTLNRTTDVEHVFAEGPPSGPTREQRGGKDYVRDYTLEEIRQLTLVNGKDEGTHRVPTLEEALDLIDGDLLVLLGLKSYEIESLAATIGGHDTANLLLFELYFPGTDQSKLRDATAATGIAAAVVLFRSRDYLTDLDSVVDQIGPALVMISANSARLTPEFISRMTDLDLRLMISGWNGPEDNKLVNETDPAPWKAMLDQGFSASTDQPELMLELLRR